VNDYIKLSLWVVGVGLAFAYLWRKGYLKRLTSYVQETKQELHKCTWPTRAELKGSTVVVVIAMALLSAFTVSVDFVFSYIIQAML